MKTLRLILILLLSITAFLGCNKDKKDNIKPQDKGGIYVSDWLTPSSDEFTITTPGPFYHFKQNNPKITQDIIDNGKVVAYVRADFGVSSNNFFYYHLKYSISSFEIDYSLSNGSIDFTFNSNPEYLAGIYSLRYIIFPKDSEIPPEETLLNYLDTMSALGTEP